MGLTYLLAAMSSPASPWVHYHTSPLGIAFYYDLGTVEISRDGRSGKVAAKIVRGAKAREFLPGIGASSTGFLVFDCTARTYRYEWLQDFDDKGRPLKRQQFAIEVATPPNPLFPEVEPAYVAACSPAGGKQPAKG
jgi:hypothetical protein